VPEAGVTVTVLAEDTDGLVPVAVIVTVALAGMGVPRLRVTTLLPGPDTGAPVTAEAVAVPPDGVKVTE
jgi:hypothetical protein